MSKSRAEPMFDEMAERALIDAVRDAPLGVVVVHGSDNAAPPLYVNHAARSMLGYAQHENLPGGLMDFAGVAVGGPGQVAATHKDGRRSVIAVVRLERIDDRAVLFLSPTTPDASFSTEARFRELIEGAPDGIAITRNGTLLYVNAAAARLLGYERSDLIGMRITDFLDEDGRRRFVERAGASPPSAPFPPAEYRTQRRDKSWIVAEITSLPIAWDGGPAVVAFARDITERAKIAEQLKRADRLASLGTLSAGVAHEINNPLTFMTLGIELLAKRLNSATLDEDERGGMLATLSELRRGAERVAEIVRDLRTFSRADDQGSEAVDVRAAVESAHRMVDHRARHLATVTIDIPELPLVRANMSRLEQVFVNLLLNACQAFEEDGSTNRIDIRGGVLESGRVFIDILDNGPGIAREVLPRIFDPFFTTKTVGEGTGLGLAICHGIIARYGGELSVESAVGRTLFRVTLPPMHAADPMLAPDAPRDDSPRARILIVDDEPAIVRSLKRSLSVRHEVVTAGTGEDALALIAKDPTFDVVLCDLAMPGFNGIDLYHRIQDERPELAARFVVMTGGAVSQRARKFLESWSGPRLDKPFSIRKLEQLLAEATGAPHSSGRPQRSDP